MLCGGLEACKVLLACLKLIAWVSPRPNAPECVPEGQCLKLLHLWHHTTPVLPTLCTCMRARLSHTHTQNEGLMLYTHITAQHYTHGSQGCTTLTHLTHHNATLTLQCYTHNTTLTSQYYTHITILHSWITRMHYTHTSHTSQCYTHKKWLTPHTHIIT